MILETTTWVKYCIGRCDRIERVPRKFYSIKLLEHIFRLLWPRRLELLRAISKSAPIYLFLLFQERALTSENFIDETNFEHISKYPSGYAVVFRGYGYGVNWEKPSMVVTKLMNKIVVAKSLNVPLWMFKLVQLRASDVIKHIRQCTLSECTTLLICCPATFCVPCCCRLFQEFLTGQYTLSYLIDTFTPLLKYYKKGTLVNILTVDKKTFCESKYVASICKINEESLQSWHKFENSLIDETIFPAQCNFLTAAAVLKQCSGVEMATKLPAPISQCGVLVSLPNLNHDYCNYVVFGEGYVMATSHHVSTGCHRLLRKMVLLFRGILNEDILYCIWLHSQCFRQL